MPKVKAKRPWMRCFALEQEQRCAFRDRQVFMDPYIKSRDGYFAV